MSSEYESSPPRLTVAKLEELQSQCIHRARKLLSSEKGLTSNTLPWGQVVLSVASSQSQAPNLLMGSQETYCSTNLTSLPPEEWLQLLLGQAGSMEADFDKDSEPRTESSSLSFPDRPTWLASYLMLGCGAHLGVETFGEAGKDIWARQPANEDKSQPLHGRTSQRSGKPSFLRDF
ncbi:uncharacterized protein KY384_007684 [Bacidia gigantensis]|uniref:uncharacterized protein n=1 Tax=Bacidia gigantensis TaxID=2732470 RepID=UPI001D054B1C|nr:uncharacterized protein KY384_007684 [Bacidia gigantensis]KAG8527532.1 hypothetical protein KY384_007684 [Bacidia gigantensis]